MNQAACPRLRRAGKGTFPAMPHKNLRQLGPGFYVDERNALYFDMSEFLAARGLEDTPETRQAVWKEVRRNFGSIAITEISREKDSGPE
jgi:hypothetical protein